MSEAKNISEIPATMGERIAQIRAQRGLSVEQLAAMANLTPADVQDIEANTLLPKNIVILRIANALEVWVDYLLYGSIW